MRSLLASLAFVGVSFAALGLGCSSSSDGAASPSTDDAGVHEDSGLALDGGVDASDAGAVAMPAGRRIVDVGGPVLAHPTIVPLVYGDDADRARTETLLGALPGSDYWKLFSEYGVGDVTLAPSIEIAATAPTTLSDATIEQTLAPFTTGGAGPLSDGTQIYTLIIPQQTTLQESDGSDFCSYGGAYHESSASSTPSFVFAIVPHCAKDDFDSFAVALTHELMEAATDPLPLVTPAWADTDPGHIGFRGEVGDLCDYGGMLSGPGAPLFGTRVERLFSNAAAAKGGDPCVPALGVPYFNAAPVPTDDVSTDDFVLGKLTGRGVKLGVGETKTVALVLGSDPGVPAWQVVVQAVDGETQGQSTAVTTSLDRATGAAGDVLTLTVTRTAHAGSGGDILFVYSADGKEFWTDTILVTD